jgi:taurine dioxygenase
MTIDLQPIGGSFAMEVKGVPLWEPLDAATEDAIREAYRTHSLLVFRRQPLSEDELYRFGHIVGEPQPYIEAHWQSAYREIVLLSNMRGGSGELIGGLSNRELTWHTDQSYNAEPVTGCYLYGVEVPADGGNTSWASLYNAYEALPPDLQSKVENLVGIFSYASRASQTQDRQSNQSIDERTRNTPDVKHALVNVNPVTGRKAIYIDPKTVTGIVGMPDDEAHALLDELLAYTVRPENVYLHDWQVGDLVLWDNAVLLHHRQPFPDTQNRLLKRMIIGLPQDGHIVPAALA